MGKIGIGLTDGLLVRNHGAGTNSNGEILRLLCCSGIGEGGGRRAVTRANNAQCPRMKHRVPDTWVCAGSE